MSGVQRTAIAEVALQPVSSTLAIDLDICVKSYSPPTDCSGYPGWFLFRIFNAIKAVLGCGTGCVQSDWKRVENGLEKRFVELIHSDRDLYPQNQGITTTTEGSTEVVQINPLEIRREAGISSALNAIVEIRANDFASRLLKICYAAYQINRQISLPAARDRAEATLLQEARQVLHQDRTELAAGRPVRIRL